ncbi:restriction endonuclease subunit S [Gordonia sp. UBA7860]|uniref:restriction endonuclease subunit S n=1 Tax=Gordonia sp. UBA7860 TaxID=1946579 RepID=UPI00257EFBB2|nr:restriction endonuclease subunit S [Gordonia sp. UBA7860]
MSTITGNCHGAPWIGVLPAGWRLENPKWLFSVRKERARPKDRQLTSSQDEGVVYQDEYMSRRGARVVQVIHGQEGLRHVEAGDFVISLRSFQGGIEFSRVPGKISPAYTILKPSALVEAGYFRYLLKSLGFIQELRSTSNQLRDGQTLSIEHFAQVRVPVPPSPDQTAIANFLDRETAKIDALIAKQEQLIATLQEDRIATITHAVTRGIDDSVSAADSGVPWLGPVATGWTISRFSRHVRIVGGQVDPKRREFAVLPLIAPNHIESGTGRLLSLETAEEQGADSGKYLVHTGQVVYSKIRPNLAKATIAPVDGLCSADMYALEPKSRLLDPRFLLYILLSRPFTDYAVDSSMRVAMPKVNHESLGAAPIWFPSLDMQREIVLFIDRHTAQIDELVAKVVQAMRVQREYRAALITDAVTGKIDMREMI